MKTLSKSTTDKKICGVCGGFAVYLDADPNVIRILTIVCALFSAGVVGIAYIACAILLPDDTAANENRSNTPAAPKQPDYVAPAPPAVKNESNDSDEQ